MELVRGRSLTERDRREASRPQRVRRALASAIADGLAAAHRQHVTHRDLKPDNIMIGDDGRPKILDFGLAKLGGVAAVAPTTPRDDDRRREASSAPSRYMSPEQAQGKPVDPRSDIFSSGIVLYEMTTGRRPFAGDNSVSTLDRDPARHAAADRQIVSPAAPAPLDRIIRRCLGRTRGALRRRRPVSPPIFARLHADAVSGPRRGVAGATRGRAALDRLVAAVAMVLRAASATCWYAAQRAGALGSGTRRCRS